RHTSGGGAVRSLLDGVLTLDSLQSPLIFDDYFWRRQLNPGPQELFVCEWRVRVTEAYGPLDDAALGIARDRRGILAFGIGVDHISGLTEDFSIPVSPMAFHTYRVESADMLAYSLFIDGGFARSGQWGDSLNESYVAWGDGTLGGGIRSLSQWDYVRF